MKQKNSFDTSKKFNKHHHREEFFLYKSINEKEALCPTCNHPVGRHKIELLITVLRNYVIVNFQDEAKTDYFKWFMKERRNQKNKESFFDFNDA